MNFSFEEYKGQYPNPTYKAFPDDSAAKLYCLSNDACVATKGNEAIISLDDVEDSEETIMRKKKINFLSKEQIQDISSGGEVIRTLNMSIVEKDAKAVLIIYKCDKEEDRISLNFSKAELYGVLFMEESGFELTQIPVPPGLYIARHVFFIETAEDKTQEYSLVFSNSQLVTYVDGVMVKRSWAQGNNVYVHSVSIKLTKGIHSITNDFSFDTNVLKVDIGEPTDLFLMPSLDGELIDAYSDNKLFFSTKSRLESKKFEDCTADKLTEEKCISRLKAGTLEADRQLVLSYEINKDILPFIEYVYTHDDIDYDLSRDIKKTAEAYMVSKFSEMDFSDMGTLLFLIRFVDNIVKEKLLTQEVLESCVDETSQLFKSGVCRNLETSLPDSAEIKNTIDRRNYIYCTMADGDNFMFGKGEDRCKVMSEEEKRAMRVAKCGDYVDNSYCRNLSLSDEEVKLKRNLFIDNLLSSKEGIATLAKDYSSDFGKSMLFMDQCSKTLEEKQKSMKAASDNLSKNSDQGISEIIQMTYDLANAELSTATNDYAEANRLYEISKAKYPDEYKKELDRQATVKYIVSEYLKDRTLDEFVTNLYESGECAGCEELYSAITEGDNADIVKYSRKIKKRNELAASGGDELFSLDPEDIVINSGEVLKFCKKDPFNSKCAEYYKGIYKTKSSFTNRVAREITNTWIDSVLILIFILIFIGLLAIFLSPEVNYYRDNYEYEYYPEP